MKLSDMVLLLGLLAIPVIIVVAVVIFVTTGLLFGVAQLDGEAVAGANTHSRLIVVDSNGRLETMLADGSERRLLTADDADYQFPAWSADGTQIAALRNMEGGVALVTLRDEPTTKITPVFEGDSERPIYFYWSPAGDTLGLIAANVAGEMNFYLAATKPTSGTFPISSGQPFFWDWDAAGEQMLIHSGSGEDGIVAYLDGGGSLEGLVAGGQDVFNTPDISDDGAYIAFGMDDEAGRRIVIMDDDKIVNALPLSGQAALAWQPKRNRLAVATRSLTTTTADCRYDSLSLVSAETPDHKVALAQCLNAFFWSPDGRHIAYIAPSIFTDIRHASHELGRARLQPRNEDTYALFVLNVASGETRNLGSFVPGAIFASQFLPFFDQYAHSHAIWSPDSATIALPVAFGPTTHIAIFHLDGQEPSIITRGSTAFWQP